MLDKYGLESAIILALGFILGLALPRAVGWIRKKFPSNGPLLKIDRGRPWFMVLPWQSDHRTVLLLLGSVITGVVFVFLVVWFVLPEEAINGTEQVKTGFEKTGAPRIIFGGLMGTIAIYWNLDALYGRKWRYLAGCMSAIHQMDPGDLRDKARVDLALDVISMKFDRQRDFELFVHVELFKLYQDNAIPSLKLLRRDLKKRSVELLCKIENIEGQEKDELIKTVIAAA